jgi:putative phage-type endonuclease
METHLEPGSDSWKFYRSNSIGASDAPIILGDSPYKTPHTLWCEKLGLKESTFTNSAMSRGVTLEPFARDWCERELGVDLPPIFMKHKSISFIHANLDGYNVEQGVCVEIKCGSRVEHEDAKLGKSPKKYFAQFQHQLEVTGLKKMFYVSYDGESGIIVEIRRDDSYIENMIEEEKRFWTHVQNFVEPELSDRDYIKRDDKEYQEQLMIYLHNKKQAKHWKELEEQSKEIVTSMTETNTICNGCKILKRTMPGIVDYKKLTTDLDISPEVVNKYRKQPTSHWMIRT